MPAMMRSSAFCGAIKCLQSELGGSPCSNRQLEFVGRVLRHIADTWARPAGYSSDVAREQLAKDILVPQTDGCLVEAYSLMFDDAPWLSGELLCLSTSVHVHFIMFLLARCHQ